MKLQIVSLFAIVACCGALTAQGHGHGGQGHGGQGQSGGCHGGFAYALFGDWPYSTVLLGQAPLLINSVNSDPDVDRVLFLGDIHSGSMPCTGVGLAVPPPVYDPNWNIGICSLFNQFADPLVYTPGDNEWCDCHKKKEGNNVVGSGAPMNELAAVRALFFPQPGRTLGAQTKHVFSQAQHHSPAHPSDGQFVENVMWQDHDVVFVMLNVPGSNNDGIAWTGPYADEPARLQEVADRDGANSRWLDAAFDFADLSHAKGVVIGIQADMWDPEAAAPGGDGLGNYTPLVQQLAQRCLQFGKPVLLANGDSHVFNVDQPLADPIGSTGVIHNTPAVPNLTRLTVEGSTAADEWVKLYIDPHSPEVFGWERVVYL